MKKILLLTLTLALTTAIVACKDEESKPTAPVVTEPSSTPAPSATPVATATPVPVVKNEYCNSSGKAIECEAQLSYTMKTCRTADDTNWAGMFFKDEVEADAYALSIGTAFRFKLPNGGERYIGKKEVGHFGWVCWYK